VIPKTVAITAFICFHWF